MGRKPNKPTDNYERKGAMEARLKREGLYEAYQMQLAKLQLERPDHPKERLYELLRWDERFKKLKSGERRNVLLMDAKTGETTKPVKPTRTNFDPEDFAGKDAQSIGAAVRWAAERMYFKVDFYEAPSMMAVTMLKRAQEDPDSFCRDFLSKLVPREIDDGDAFSDDGRNVTRAVDRCLAIYREVSPPSAEAAGAELALAQADGA